MQLWIALLALIVSILFSSGGIIWALVWKISDIRASLNESLNKEISDEQKAREVALTLMKTTIDRINVDTMREIAKVNDGCHAAAAEVSRAVTGKIQQIELYIRDEYVNKQEFRDDLSTITKIVDTLGTRIERRMEGLEGKMDDMNKLILKVMNQTNTTM